MPVSVVTKLYKAFIWDVLNIASSAQCDERFIYYAGNGSSITFLKKFKHRFRLRRQTGKHLGARMYKAILYCLKNHSEKIVIIGTDCLTITQQNIETAFQKLESYDCVLGPSQDGGYYLMALKSPHFKLFTGIDWSTSSALKQTLQKAKKLKLKTYLLHKREDIDTINNLKNISKRIKNTKTAMHTQAILKNIIL